MAQRTNRKSFFDRHKKPIVILIIFGVFFVPVDVEVIEFQCLVAPCPEPQVNFKPVFMVLAEWIDYNRQQCFIPEGC